MQNSRLNFVIWTADGKKSRFWFRVSRKNKRNFASYFCRVTSTSVCIRVSTESLSVTGTNYIWLSGFSHAKRVAKKNATRSVGAICFSSDRPLIKAVGEKVADSWAVFLNVFGRFFSFTFFEFQLLRTLLLSYQGGHTKKCWCTSRNTISKSHASRPRNRRKKWVSSILRKSV